MLIRQRRRFLWLFILVLAISLAAVGGVIAMLLLLLNLLEGA